MKVFFILGLAAVLAVGMAGGGYAAVGSDRASEANARNTTPPQSVPSPNQGNQPGHAPSTHGQSGSGTSVGPGAGGGTANAPLGYAKGRSEGSSVGKDR